MPATEIKPESLDEAASALGGGEVLMVNLLHYRLEAQYPGGGQPSCSGREAYFTRYVPAFAEVTRGQGIGAQWVGQVHTALVGSAEEAWDDVAIVRYPSFAAFRAVIESAEYQATVEPHRWAALADWRLLATTALPLPNAGAGS